ncbi:MAG: DinB family protein [Roseiflexaceae bacterium]
MDEPQFKALLDELAAFPAALKTQLQGLSDAALRFQPTPDAWSIVEIVGHMTDVDAIWPGRIRQMLSTDNPELARVDNDDVRRRDYQNKQLSFLLITLAERRAEFIEMLRLLRPSQLERTGQHPTRGPITVAGGVGALADHDRGHREQIAANLAAFEQAGGG